MFGRYRSLSKYVEITSSTNRISYGKSLLLTCQNLGRSTFLYISSNLLNYAQVTLSSICSEISLCLAIPDPALDLAQESDV